MNSWLWIVAATLGVGYWVGWTHGIDAGRYEARTAYQEAPEPAACVTVDDPRRAACAAMLDQAYTVLAEEAALMREFYPPLSPHNQ